MLFLPMPLFNKKNVTTGLLSFWCAFIVVVVTAIVLLFAKMPMMFFLSSLFAIGIISYFIFRYAIQYFFYDKIKLLYKFISQTKAGVREESLRDIVMPHLTMQQVEDDVEKWAKDHSLEIDNYEKNELYRREFLMNFAHEIKTPIFTVQGYLHTLQDGAINDLQVRDKFVSNAIIGIDRLGELVLQIDEIAKLESGILEISKQKFVIQELINTVIQEFELQAKNGNLTLQIKQGCEGNTEVFADKQKIKQVLVNLINNAIKYAKPNGKIEAGIYSIDDNNVFVEISDDGIGIAEEFVHRVFERFYRTDTGRSRNKGGSGLGLAIVKHIIEAHGHHVTCRSKIQVGSSFGFGLSAAQ
jgi:two-component system, OmpR family, phosphate regulon sensor histidine kinase PhoR